MMTRSDVTNAEKYRRIMEAYQIENEYGRTIEAYRDTIEIEGRETTVDFLRFGRVALVYMSIDEKDAGVWDQHERSWVPLDPSLKSSIRAGLKIDLPLSQVMEEEWFENMLKQPAEEHPLVIELQQDDSWIPIGNCGFHEINWRFRSACGSAPRGRRYRRSSAAP